MLRAIWKRTSIDALECKYNNGNMVSSTVPVCFILCLFVTFGRSFYPNSIGVDISEDDYTISSITRQAILNVTAQFLQSLLPNSTSVSLETLDPLTESSLFNAYYGGEVSAKKFSGNVLAIATSAMKFCRLENRAAHFFSEEIADGLALLLSLRLDLERVLSKPYNLTNFNVVRELIGAAICVQSSFYSNTNWVETHGSDLYEDLGVTGANMLRLADSSLVTCVNCPIVNTSYVYNCSDNMMPGIGLTSGYLSTKPNLGFSEAGKCSHGGVYDSSRESPATGGINKETSNPLFSPHHHLHDIAGQSAVKSAINLFQDQDNGILGLMGEEKFKTLLGLGTGVTLCVVMDTTGSMLDDINAVKQQTQSLVNTRAGTVHLPESFIFVPFADPDTGPLHEVSSGADFLQILQGVVPNGGGDCPERTLEGILLGLQASAEFSKVFIFTDADAKDGHLMDQVIATAFSKQIVLEFLLTGECDPSEVQYPGLFANLAEQTGGNVFYSSKSDINEASGVLDLLSGGDQVSLMRITTSGKRDYDIPVDETLRDFSVFISSASGTYLPGMSLLTPSEEVLTTQIQTTNLVAYNVKNATTGNWRLHLDSPVPGLQVEIVGASSVNVHVQMFETTEDGQAFPIEGKPVTGKDVVLGVSILSAAGVGNFTTVTLMNTNGNTITEVPLTQNTEDFLTASVTVPGQPFQILLTGTDNAGNTIHRLIEDYYEPQDFRLEINQPTPIRADPSVPIEIPYTLHNYGGSDENFTVTITDANGLVDSSFVVSASAAGNGSGVFILDLQGLNLTENYDLGSLSVVITSTGSGTVSTNYNSFGVYLTNETAVSAADIAVEYILPTTSPETTPKTEESTSDRASDNTVLIVCLVSGAAALTGLASFITLRQWHKGCGKVGPYSYPKAKPTVPKPNLRRKFSFS